QAGSKRTLAICGDLHSVGSGVNLYRTLLTPKARRRIVERLRPILPDFDHEVDVVVGAGGLDHRSLPTARERAIEQFWTTDWTCAVHVHRMTYDSVPHLPWPNHRGRNHAVPAPVVFKSRWRRSVDSPSSFHVSLPARKSR